MMHSFARHGRRPQAWWQFDAPPELVYDFETEKSSLFEAGLLTEPERDALLVFWRSEFERCHQPDFVYCEGPGQFWRGAPAREAHMRWCDCPASLIRQWTRERRNAPKAVDARSDPCG